MVVEIQGPYTQRMRSDPRLDLLIDPTWLAACLDDPRVRIFDCSVNRLPQPTGPSLWESRRNAWKARHIPGAGYIHMAEDLCDPAAPFPFTLPAPDAVAALLSSFGVPQEATIVLYGSGYVPAIHRVWWVLRASGTTDVRILDASLEQWIASGHPVRSGEEKFEPTSHVCMQSPIVVCRQEVVASLGDSTTCLINALSRELFEGSGNQMFGRRGRIPGSLNTPAELLLDSDTGQLRPSDELRRLMPVEVLERCRKIIPYCGGGLAASTVFFALAVLGYDNVALYDGSLFDWSSDPALPMATGPE